MVQAADSTSPGFSAVLLGYGDATVVVGIFCVKGTEKGKTFLHRERFAGTWIKTNGTWQCVTTTSTLIAAKQSAD